MDDQMLRGDREAYLAALDAAGNGDDGPNPGEMAEIVDGPGRRVVRRVLDREQMDTLVADYDVRVRP